MISLEKLKENGYYIVPVSPNWKEVKSGLIDFYNDPVKNPLGTPSGKLEFYSDRLAENFPEDNERGPMPKWVIGGPESEGWSHDESLEGERCKQYPLLFVSNHPRWRFHVQCDDVPWLREIPTCKIKGYDGYMYEPVWINPVDAAVRGIEQGDIVKVFNERGIVLGGAHITEGIIPGAAYQDHGAHVDLITDGIDRGGSNNLIAPTNGTSKNCWGQATSGYLVEVQKLEPNEMDEWRKKYPEAFARDYDPACGLKSGAWVEGGI
jgi:trimethylamine-N-oxide reductase (cytochrome c)